MTREEAIEYWEGLRKTFSSQLEKEENHFGRMHLQTTIDALDMAISALRQQETVTNRNDLNDPLTLDELKKELAAMRNELCFKCGNYREAHNGACDGCRWRKDAR